MPRGADLPAEWSGKDKSIDVHAAACRMLPLWADIDEGTVRGFIALRETSPYAAEIYSSGVHLVRFVLMLMVLLL